MVALKFSLINRPLFNFAKLFDLFVRDGVTSDHLGVSVTLNVTKS